MQLALRIGLRYARSRRSFISFVSVMSLAGLALSVAVLVFVQAVVAGFEREMNERVLGIVPHVTVLGRVPVEDAEQALEVIRAVPGVVGASPVVAGAALLATAERVAGVSLTGVEPDHYGTVSRLFEFADPGALVAGRFDILVGSKVAQRLRVAVGDAVAVVLPEATVTPFGAFARQRRFRVAGIVDTGSQLDGASAYLHVRDAARLFRLGASGAWLPCAQRRCVERWRRAPPHRRQDRAPTATASALGSAASAISIRPSRSRAACCFCSCRCWLPSRRSIWCRAW